jgi:hypothetical protein
MATTCLIRPEHLGARLAVLAALAYRGSNMSIELRHHQIVKTISECIADACTLPETLWVCAMRCPAVSSDDLRQAFKHVGFFDIKEVERLLPGWERVTKSREFEESRTSFARSIKGLDKA